MREFSIEAKGRGKGRSFSALLLASVTADRLWEGGAAAADAARPVWAMFAGGDAELRPFAANLAAGCKAELKQERSFSSRRAGPRVELLRSAGYRYLWQREDEGSLVTAYLPSLFLRDPGLVDPAGVAFVALPDRAWVDEQPTEALAIARHMRHVDPTVGLDDAVARARALGPLACLFAVYLDRRVRCPLLTDARFLFQVFAAFLAAGLASLGWDGERRRADERPFGVHEGFGFIESGTASVGLAPGVACKATHDEVGRLLAEQAALFFGVTR